MNQNSISIIISKNIRRIKFNLILIVVVVAIAIIATIYIANDLIPKKHQFGKERKKSISYISL